MPIGAWFERSGVSQENYDSVLAKLGEEPPEGCLYHIAGPVEGGWRVIEIWDSEEAQRRFQKERLNPAFEAVGMPVVTPTYFAVHNTLPPPEAMAALADSAGRAAS